MNKELLRKLFLNKIKENGHLITKLDYFNFSIPADNLVININTRSKTVYAQERSFDSNGKELGRKYIFNFPLENDNQLFDSCLTIIDYSESSERFLRKIINKKNQQMLQ